MDLGTIVGMVLAFVCILAGLTIEGGKIPEYISPSAFLIVVPSTMGVSLAAGYLKDVKFIIAATKGAILTKSHDSSEIVDTMVKFAEKARREGLLALEEATKDVHDPFLKKGIQLAIDGTDPEQLREILEAEVYAKKVRDKIPSKYYTDMGGFAPTLGIVGTVLGLVVVLKNLSDPSTLGPHISAAFIATLYGVGSANVLFLPMGKKIAAVSETECHHMEAIIEGVLAIQAGANPRVIQMKLAAILGYEDKKSGEDKAA